MSDLYDQFEWLTLADAARELSLSSGKLRRLLEERVLMTVQVDGQPRMPKDFLRDGEAVPGLRGTLISLADRGVEGDEAMQWLLTEEATLGETPISALRAGHKAPVRRALQLLAL